MVDQPKNSGELASEAEVKAERLVAIGQLPEAIIEFKNVIRIDPSRLHIYERLLEVYAKAGQRSAASAQLQAILGYYEKKGAQRDLRRVRENALALGLERNLGLSDSFERGPHWSSINKNRQYLEELEDPEKRISELFARQENAAERRQAEERKLERRRNSHAFALWKAIQSPLRWAVAVPVSILAYFIVYVLVASVVAPMAAIRLIASLVLNESGFAVDYPWYSQIMGSAFAAFAFVSSCSNIAPTKHRLVAVISGLALGVSFIGVGVLSWKLATGSCFDVVLLVVSAAVAFCTAFFYHPET